MSTPTNVGNLHPDAREHFSTDESLAIEQLIGSYFISNPSGFMKRWRPPVEFLGGVTFRPNWVFEKSVVPHGREPSDQANGVDAL
jgi:hypothetical protein